MSHPPCYIARVNNENHRRHPPQARPLRLSTLNPQISTFFHPEIVLYPIQHPILQRLAKHKTKKCEISKYLPGPTPAYPNPRILSPAPWLFCVRQKPQKLNRPWAPKPSPPPNPSAPPSVSQLSTLNSQLLSRLRHFVPLFACWITFFESKPLPSSYFQIANQRNSRFSILAPQPPASPRNPPHPPGTPRIPPEPPASPLPEPIPFFTRPRFLSALSVLFVPSVPPLHPNENNYQPPKRPPC